MIAQRPLGRTGMEIPAVTLGGGRVGGVLIFPDESVRAAALERALEAGIDWVDTAAMYGDGESEATLGRLGQRFRISTKVNIKREDARDVGGAIERSLEQSLRRLQRDRVELLQLHNHLGEGDRFVSVAQVLGKGGVADALERLKAGGLIRAMGMTAAGDATACLEVIRSGRFDTAQIYYNALNPSAAWTAAPGGWSAQDFSGVMDACVQEGMGMLGIRVLAGGSLASAVRHGREFVMATGSDLDQEGRRASAMWRALGSGHGTPAQLALRFSLANARLATSVVGVADISQLEEAIGAALMGPLPPAAIAQLEPLWLRDWTAP